MSTRIIGLTATEFAALEDRDATLILGVPREGMEPIVAGQELLAVDGWNFPDAVNPDACKVRLRVTGAPYQTKPLYLTGGEIARMTGPALLPRKRISIKALVEHLHSLARDGFDWNDFTDLLAIPVEVLPGAQGEVG